MKALVVCLLLAGAGCAPLLESNDGASDYQPIEALDPVQAELDLQFCVDEINRYRATMSLPPLARSAEMEAFAAEGAVIDTYSDGPHEHFMTTPFPGPYVRLGENELRSWGLREHRTVRKIITEGTGRMWAEGPGGGHYETMIADFDEVGCGLHLDVPLQTVTVVQDFRKL